VGVTALDAQARAGVQTITDDDVREDEGERDHVPAYYEGHACDFWFRLFDVRRLVSDDTPAVIEEAAKLRNAGYHDRPVSLYGGMVDAPLLVHRDPEVQAAPIQDSAASAGLAQATAGMAPWGTHPGKSRIREMASCSPSASGDAPRGQDLERRRAGRPSRQRDCRTRACPRTRGRRPTCPRRCAGSPRR